MSSWTERAKCRDMAPALFFPPENYSTRPPSKEAVIACASCPVSSECYMYALRHENFGYWAGTTAQDRRKLRKAAGIHLESPKVEPLHSIGHGSEAGYQRHRRAGNSPCVSCSSAHAVAVHSRIAQGENREEIRHQTQEERKAERVREGAGRDYAPALGSSRRDV